MNNPLNEHMDSPRTQADVDVAYNEGIREGLIRAARLTNKVLEEAHDIIQISLDEALASVYEALASVEGRKHD